MTTTDSARILEELAALREEVARLRDESDIRRLQYLYGYYDDYRDWEQLIALFAEDCWVDIGSRGKYVGKEQVGRFFREVMGQNRAFLERNEIYNHLQLQMVITVERSGLHAKARSRTLIQVSVDGGPAMVWGEGVYESSFVRVGGEWRIEHMFWAPSFFAKVSGIEAVFFAGSPASTEIPPDHPTADADPELGRRLVPYHFADDFRSTSTP